MLLVWCSRCCYIIPFGRVKCLACGNQLHDQRGPLTCVQGWIMGIRAPMISQLFLLGTWIDGGVVLGRYSYMADLRILENKVSPWPCSPQLAQVNTPLRAGRWESMLQDHPDQEFARYLVRGIKEGFHIGFDRDSVKCRGAQQNMQSAIENSSVVTGYLEKDCRLEPTTEGFYKCPCE